MDSLMTAKYVIGIDLGTTNSVLAYSPLDVDEQCCDVLPIPQLCAENSVEARTSLASFCYLAPEGRPVGGLDLPWAQDRKFCVGELARRQSAEAAEHTVSAAKSWLSHGRVDRRSAILPWQAPEGLEKISPLVAAQRYLEHLVSAWNTAFPDAPAAHQQIVLTVPASFDAVARELTREAAIAAGLPNELVLLEEPQAAVYACLASMGDQWRKVLHVGDRLLVCDVGGGTTDLTLIQIADRDGELALERIAVGDHLLVGGDNMDLALAYHVAGKFKEGGTELDPWQSVALWHACRAAKETLLAGDGPDSHTISVLGRGSKLIGGTVSVQVDRQFVADLLVDGFLPRCQLDDEPQRQRASGFQQLGLPFESDTAVTRHLAHFLSRQATDPATICPTHLLFNGGVFKSNALRSRLIEVVDSWHSADATTEPLSGAEDLDHAVARGAAHYGWVKQHDGVRIRGGVARSYYIGIETAGLAIPGAPRPLNALCVVPFGMEEGTEFDIPAADIGLVHGQPAEFRFFSSAARKEDRPGEVLQKWDATELIETSPLTATLPPDEAVNEPYVPVRFQSRITELGMFELWCVSTQSDGRWKLEFNVREE
jgi:hypothetical protein